MAGVGCSSVINGTLFTLLLNFQLMSLLTDVCDVATAPRLCAICLILFLSYTMCFMCCATHHGDLMLQSAAYCFMYLHM